jgi:hypothetical protein
MTDNTKSETGGNAADSARRAREKLTDENKSGTQEKQPNKHAEEDLKHEGAERAASAAISKLPPR